MKLAFERWGDTGGSPILLIHGVTDHHRTWWPVGEGLAAGGSAVWAVDLRGHGDSPLPDVSGGDLRAGHGYMLADHAQDIVEFVETHGLDRPVVAGHSLGGLVAQESVLRAPERFAGAVLVATTSNCIGNAPLGAVLRDQIDGKARLAVERRGLRYPDEALMLTLPELDPTLAEWIAKVWCFDPKADPIWCRQSAEMTNRLALQTWIGAMSGLLRAETASRLAGLEVPVLSIYGDCDDIFPIEPDQVELNRALEEAGRRNGIAVETKLYSEAGHNLTWHEPQRLCEDILAFRRRVA